MASSQNPGRGISRRLTYFTAAPFLHRRTAADFRKWAAVDHNKTGLVSYSPSTPAEDIFGANASCILTPDNANGPYFVSQEISKLFQIVVFS